MSGRWMLPLLWVTGVLVVAMGIWLAFVRPQGNRLEVVLSSARLEVQRATDHLEESVGSSYVQGLAATRRSVEENLQRLRATFATQKEELGAWFARLAVADGSLPRRDVFPAAYAFAEDELRRELVTAVGKARGGKTPEQDISLWVPDHKREDRIPRAEELVPCQRAFNAQRLVLLAAANAGGFPVEAPKISLQARTLRLEEDRFFEHRFELVFTVPPRQLSGLLRAVLELDGRGPGMRLLSVETRPHPLDPGQEFTPMLRVRVVVAMIVKA